MKRLRGGAHPHFAAHCTKSASAAAAKWGKMFYYVAENSLNLEKTAQKSYFVDIFESKHSAS